ncbi:Alpha/Beta hydrolase protein [Podospora didyma]|uniref:Alpha/Beta hydrolase protein n=1 Tax=Podospora didyma TaxID=330526 RepID=A0AAE0U1W6_9PEZI|nr:Alpha/Beta hydrolase protein [Podospora didyma]
MFDFYLSYKWLHWRRPAAAAAALAPGSSLLQALPAGIERFFIPTSGGGEIEILYAQPRCGRGNETRRSAIGTTGDDVSPSPSPLFFAHGGMGGAFIWLEYMQFFSARGIPCYAVSTRGHGNSWYPSYLRMVYGTTKRMLADDLVAGILWAQEREGGGKEVVLVGHSSGGGLSQFILSEQDVKVKGLALIGAVPGLGSASVYGNWCLLDPWFLLRMLFHGGHPNSPLSHPALTRKVFFSEAVSDAYMESFQRRMNTYESLLWPLGMFRAFVNPQKLLEQISSFSSRGTGQQRILVLFGGGDKIMTFPIMEKLANTYRKAISSLAGQKKLDDRVDDTVENIPGEGDQDTAGQGVRFCVVTGAGHHVQNDVNWEVGAKKLLTFYEQL